MKNECNTPDICTCPYCRAYYYSMSLFRNALRESKTEDELYHALYAPLARICNSRWSIHSSGYEEDARALAAERMFIYGRKYGLSPDERCLRALIRICVGSASDTFKEFNKNIRPFTEIYHDSDDNESSHGKNRQSPTLGRRVYPRLSDDNEGDETNLIDRAAKSIATEDALISNMDKRATAERNLNSVDAKEVFQIIANLAFACGITQDLLKEQKSDIIATRIVIQRVEFELVPLVVEAGLNEGLAHKFCAQALDVLPSELSLSKLLNKAYNRGRYNILTKT